jgi:hypothetical protein
MTILVSSSDGYQYKPPLVNYRSLCLECFKSLTLGGEKADEAKDDHVRPYIYGGTKMSLQLNRCGCDVKWQTVQHVEYSCLDR